MSTRQLEARAKVAREALAELELERYEFRTDEFFVRVPAGSNEQQLADTLLASGGFQYVAPDWSVYPVACPDDSEFGSQWHHEPQLMNSCAAWDFATGDPSVVVAICDTGLRTTHEDIQLHRREGYNAVDQIFENAGGDISPVHPHGTQTTGCAAANGNNGVGVSGVGWDLGHRMMRVSNVSSGNSSIGVLTHAAMVAADLGDKVASVSYSGVGAPGVQTAGQYCRANGTLLVWAAGNASSNLGGSRNDDVVVVGSTTINDDLSGFSNFGSLVDLTAPGSSVRTMNSGSDSDYANVSGTSFSCPLVAGLAGLLWSINPNLTPQQVEDALRDGCDDLGNAGIDNTFGYGRIDVLNSVNLVNLAVQISFP
ncbi:MAG: S8 family serine peptidase, partial [Myxococcota bacterium]